MRKALKMLAIAFVILFAMLLVFLLYARLADEVEASRVEEAVRRDCQMEMDISIEDIREPGIVIKQYVRNGRTVELICYGSSWGCECEQ